MLDTAPTPHLKAPSTHLARLRPSITITRLTPSISIPRPPRRPCTTWSKWRQHHLSMEDVAGAWRGLWHAQRRPEGKNDSALDGNSLAALRILRPCPTETHHGAIGACCCTAKQHGWHGLVTSWFWYKEIPKRHGHLDPFQGHTGFCCDPAIILSLHSDALAREECTEPLLKHAQSSNLQVCSHSREYKRITMDAKSTVCNWQFHPSLFPPSCETVPMAVAAPRAWKTTNPSLKKSCFTLLIYIRRDGENTERRKS